MPWEYCRQNIVKRGRPYELKSMQEIEDIHSKFKSTFLEVCEDHKIPCLIIQSPLTAELLKKIRNPTIDTETMGLIDRSVFDLGLAWESSSAGFIIADTEEQKNLEFAYFPPCNAQLRQPRISLRYAQKLLLACESIWAYNSDFDVGALNLKGHVKHYDLWLMTVNYILLQPHLHEKAKEILERTEKGNMRTTFDALAAFICEQAGLSMPPHPHKAKEDAVSEHFLKEYMIDTWPGGWPGPEHFMKYGLPWYLFNNFDRYLSSTAQVPDKSC